MFNYTFRSWCPRTAKVHQREVSTPVPLQLKQEVRLDGQRFTVDEIAHNLDTGRVIANVSRQGRVSGPQYDFTKTWTIAVDQGL